MTKQQTMLCKGFLVLLLCSCSKYYVDICHEDIGDEGYGAFWAKTHFPYVIDAVKMQKINSGYPQVKVGMTMESISGILGKPDIKVAEYQDCSKENRRLTMYIFIYVLAMRQSESADGMKAIFLNFTDKDSLFHVYNTENTSQYPEIGKAIPIHLE